jgi:hypothetical protein
MALLNRTSLMLTLDYVNEALLYGKEISLADQQAITRWITTRQGNSPSYRGLYSPTNTDLDYGVSLFTGEDLSSSASALHYLGQEAARLICLFAPQDPETRPAYERASQWMRDHPTFTQTGMQCCGRCTIAYWRHFWVGEFEHKQEALENGLKALQNDRDGKGKWKRFPYYYTLLALSEIDLEPARQELRYSLPVMERYLKGEKPGLYYHRRKAIVEKALNQVS